MKSREQLQEKYEDALFALMMNYVTEAEGKRLRAENEALKQDPTAQVPEHLDQRCLQTIRQSFLKKKVFAAIKVIGTILGGGLLFIGCSFLLIVFFRGL